MAFSKQYVRISGAWKHAGKAHVKVSGTWKFIKNAYQKLSGVWTKIAHYNTPVPAGAIALYIGGAIPSGWTRFTSADTRLIVGAGSTYSAGDTGGATTAVFSGTTNTTGGHSGATTVYQDYQLLGGGGTYPRQYPYGSNNSSRGSHSHSYSAVPDIKDVYKDYILIKATAEALLPQDACLLAHSSLNTTLGLSNTETGINRFARSNSAFGATGGAAAGLEPTLSSTNGAHGHGVGEANVTPGGCYDTPGTAYILHTGHQHIINILWTLNTYGRGLSVWKAGADGTPVAENGIIMWEGATAPDGYVLCDGNNGTPDMRNRFLKIVDIGSHGTGYGLSTNKADWSYGSFDSGEHGHTSGTINGPGSSVNSHGGLLNLHSHSGGSFTKTIVQRHYALTFVMKDAT